MDLFHDNPSRRLLVPVVSCSCATPSVYPHARLFRFLPILSLSGVLVLVDSTFCLIAENLSLLKRYTIYIPLQLSEDYSI